MSGATRPLRPFLGLERGSLRPLQRARPTRPCAALLCCAGGQKGGGKGDTEEESAAVKDAILRTAVASSRVTGFRINQFT